LRDHHKAFNKKIPYTKMCRGRVFLVVPPHVSLKKRFIQVQSYLSSITGAPVMPYFFQASSHRPIQYIQPYQFSPTTDSLKRAKVSTLSA